MINSAWTGAISRTKRFRRSGTATLRKSNAWNTISPSAPSLPGTRNGPTSSNTATTRWQSNSEKEKRRRGEEETQSPQRPTPQRLYRAVCRRSRRLWRGGDADGGAGGGAGAERGLAASVRQSARPSGFWCADPIARQDFRAQMLQKYGSVVGRQCGLEQAVSIAGRDCVSAHPQPGAERGKPAGVAGFRRVVSGRRGAGD